MAGNCSCFLSSHSFALMHLPTLPIRLLSCLSPCLAQRSDPTQFNGGSILAMAGRNSVAIAIDTRFGLGFQTISNSDINGGTSSRITLLPDSNALMAWTCGSVLVLKMLLTVTTYFLFRDKGTKELRETHKTMIDSNQRLLQNSHQYHFN